MSSLPPGPVPRRSWLGKCEGARPPHPVVPSELATSRVGARMAALGDEGRRRAHRAGGQGPARRDTVVAAAATLLMAAGCWSPSTPGPTADTSNPFFTHRFTSVVNPFTFGQDPSWTADGRILSNEQDGFGVSQVYVSTPAGTRMARLACGQPGPNGFPQERPQGDWIPFCSLRGQRATFGAPCLGGIGSDLYAMRPDGSRVTRLTGPGASFEPGGTPYGG